MAIVSHLKKMNSSQKLNRSREISHQIWIQSDKQNKSPSLLLKWETFLNLIGLIYRIWKINKIYQFFRDFSVKD